MPVSIVPGRMKYKDENGQYYDIDAFGDHIDVDATPTTNSINAVSSGGVKAYVDSRIPEVPVQDVQVNGVSVVQNGIANVPTASITIDDTAGEGDTTNVWSADKSESEITALNNEINQKQDAPETAGTAGQVLGLAEVDNELVPTWMDQSGANLPTEETAQELLEYEQSNTGLTDIMLMVIGQLFDNLPQNETATDILHSLELECERLDAIYTGWIAERVNT